MKVGIITMISDNYGNRLQNYALQEVLSELGNSVETLNNPWEIEYNVYLEWIKIRVKKILFYITKRPERFRRKLAFEKFNSDNIKFSRFWLNREADREKANNYYDLFICGSDQVWNSEANQIDGKYFAEFADKNKRASYAASFGIENVEADRTDEFRKYLLEMNQISVREQTGVEIVEKLTNKKPYCHIDPTLLLKSVKWDKLSDKCKIEKDKYVFCYFLGEPSDILLNMLNEYKKEHNVKVIVVGNSGYGDNHYNNAGPSEFVTLIKNAEFILTDSFHGTAFSVIYHKPFYTYSRKGVKGSMDTRVISLLEMVNLRDRFEPDTYNLNGIFKIDFRCSDYVLESERKKAIEYLTQITR